VSLRDRQKEAVRRDLRDAALRLFVAKGFAPTTVDDIAREAGVSRSTFFRYFRSKEAILGQEDTSGAEFFLQALASRPADEGRMVALERALVELTREMRSDERRDEFLLLDQIVSSDPALTASRDSTGVKWRHEVARTLAARDGRSEPDLEDSLAAAILRQITEHIGAQWLSDEVGRPVSDVIRSHFESVRRLSEH
jgi:AcrR family transcriptional regulator